MLQRRDAHPVFSPWRQRMTRTLPRPARPMLQLISPLGAGPLFLDPPSHDLEEGMDQILSTPRAQAHAELRRMCVIDRPITAWVRPLADKDRDAWKILGQAVRTAHISVIAKAWPSMQAGFRAETAWRSRILAQQGLHTALTGLAPSIRWQGMTLEAPFVCKHGIGPRRTRFFWLRQPFDRRAGDGLMHRRSQREEAVSGEGEPSSAGSRVGPKLVRTVEPVHVLTNIPLVTPSS